MLRPRCFTLLHKSSPKLTYLEGAVEALRLGRLTALRKEGGGVRGIVAGDIFRRLVARTMAQQMSDEVQAATAPNQYALSTRAGTECVAHVLQALTAADPNTTVLPIDGIGAFDNISRAAMLEGLRSLPASSNALPFVLLFYGAESCYLWEDDAGEVHRILQAEGGEQGDPLMPLLFSLGQHAALEAVRARLLPGERLFAFLDDIYATSGPERTAEIYAIIVEELWRHARIRVNIGKTQVWNSGGATPRGLETLGRRAWRGAGSGPVGEQGITILGTPLGHPCFVRASLEGRLAEQGTLLRRIPEIQDTQSAWLLLLFCAAARATYVCRVVAPSAASSYAAAHDEALLACLFRLLELEQSQVAREWREAASLPLQWGGLGLRSAARLAPAAHWASWSDCLAMVQARHPDVAEALVHALEEGGGQNVVLQEVVACRNQLRECGAKVPGWRDLAAGARPEPLPDEEEEPGFARGWQRHAARAQDLAFRGDLMRQLQPPDQAHLRSQSGPGSGAALMAVPTSPPLRIDASSFRILLLRRLRAALPPTVLNCRCHQFLDPLGDHRAACANAGVLARRSYPLESAAARVCREAGARVRTNVFVNSLNLGISRPDDSRRIEVIADGLPLFHGEQLAVDATLVCALRRDGAARPGAATRDGVALAAARKRKERTYPELAGGQGRARLVVLGLEVGGRWSGEAWTFVRLLAKARAREELPLMRRAAEHAWRRRWAALLSVAAQRAVAESLQEWASARGADGSAPSTTDVPEDARYCSSVCA